MRDALSLLDQVLACGDGPVNDEYVMNLLGGMDRQVLFDLSEATFARDISRTLALIDAVFKNGQDLKRFYADLLMHFRHLMLVKMDARPDMLVDLPPNEMETLARQVEGVSIAFIDQVFTLLFNAESSVRYRFTAQAGHRDGLFQDSTNHAGVAHRSVDRAVWTALLHDPNLKSVPGIVEAQSAYGETVTPPMAQPRSEPTAGDRAVAPAPAGDEPPADPDRVQPGDHGPGDDAWRGIIARIAETKPSIAAALSRSQLVSISEQAFTVKVRDNDYSMNLVKKNLSMIDAVCREHAGRGIHVDFSSGDSRMNSATSAKQKADDIRQKLLNHPLLADAVEIFSGKIEEIKIR